MVAGPTTTIEPSDVATAVPIELVGAESSALVSAPTSIDFAAATKLISELKEKKLAVAALEKLSELSTEQGLEGVIFQAVPQMIECIGDKDKKVRDAANETLKNILTNASIWSGAHVLPMLIKGMNGKPAQKVTCLEMVTAVARRCPKQVGQCLPPLIPPVTALIWDVKPDVKSAAITALDAICHCCGNGDLECFIPAVLNALQKPETMPEAVESLAGCVFVQEVEAPALAVITPVLVRGLTGDRTDVARKCCVVIDNMCKLVEHPRHVQPLMATVFPTLQKLKDDISDPEARGMWERACTTVTKAAGDGSAPVISDAAVLADMLAASDLPETLGTVAYATGLCLALTRSECWETAEWMVALRVFKGLMTTEQVETLATTMLSKCRAAVSPPEFVWEETEGKDLCRAEFGLAYGSRTLLTKTRLQLKRNQFYGLLGPNNCGKTTLMRAIAAEQVDGFPKQDEIRTIFVEHEIPEREVGEDAEGFPILNIDLTGIDWVVDTCNNVHKRDKKVTRAEVAEVMESIGFGNSENGMGKDRAADAGMLITTYSGGWKMKMQLCAAQLVQADLLMLDEPTGHLDVTNILWLEGWLRDFMSGGGSCICTSHATAFLNKMCDVLIDFEERKLRSFRGTKGVVLEEYVAKNPEKAGYFELKNDVAKFIFPVPGPLAGVKSKSRHLVKMSNVTFQYPSRDTPTVFGINLEASRVSRVAVIGANGAGKSTAIKLLTGELHATSGEVVRHPNLRLAYVAQHAFQHLEKHLTKTPAQYILTRFAGGDDTEAVDFKANDADMKVEKKQFFMHLATMELRLCEEKKEFDKAVEPEAILDRRENKKEKKKEYLTKMLQKPVEEALWIEREILVKMGFLSKVQREDEKQAMAAGLMNKALTTEGIEKHLADFGLDAEAASHTSIQSLSGGQKVKVVLGASMWLDPHVLILDEPTNYLDRDGLGALTIAIKESEGGVIIISHNREFCNAVATEKWIMQGGRLRQEGESVDKNGNEVVSVIKGQEETKYDASGNAIEMNEADMDVKKKKKAIKEIEKKLKDNKKKKTMSQDEVWEMEDRLEKLKLPAA